MKVLIVGGGPAGLYSGALIKKARPAAEVIVCERDPRGATYGWGVVLSEETLGALEEADRTSYERIQEEFARWDAIDVHFKGRKLRAYGHGFSGISRKALLNILEERCLELGVSVDHEQERDELDVIADYDLVVAADGLKSRFREAYAEHFQPSYDTRAAKYIWWGSTRRPDVFTYIVRPSEWGIFQGTPYAFTDDLSTFVVECSEATWRAAGLDEMPEDESKAFCEELFADYLQGHSLLANRSSWLNFTTVKNKTWFHKNLVLVGDAAHTVHFSIGSGTKLAMEDAIGLADALRKHERLTDALAYYEISRAPVIEAFQQAAQESLMWFESLDRFMNLEPEQFTFNFLTRSGRISYDDVRQRDANFGDMFDRWFLKDALGRTEPVLIAASPLFTPLELDGVRVLNRAVSAIGNDLAESNASPGPSHADAILHRARGGMGVVMTDLIAIAAEARVTPRDSGLYEPEHERAWREIIDQVHAESDAKVLGRLGHAGPRGACNPRDDGTDRPLASGAWSLVAASPRPYTARSQVPKEMDASDMQDVVHGFREAAERAVGAGFDMLEVHAGHGYLLASFLSPLTNEREDAFGGSAENRMRFPLEVLAAVRSIWPDDRALSVCLTVDDWAKGGARVEDAIAFARACKDGGCSIVSLVAGQTIAPSRPPSYGQHYLSRLGEMVRNEVKMPVMIRGRITSADEANTVIAGGRADLCVLDLPGLAQRDEQSRQLARVQGSNGARPKPRRQAKQREAAGVATPVLETARVGGHAQDGDEGRRE